MQHTREREQERQEQNTGTKNKRRDESTPPSEAKLVGEYFGAEGGDREPRSCSHASSLAWPE